MTSQKWVFNYLTNSSKTSKLYLSNSGSIIFLSWIIAEIKTLENCWKLRLKNVKFGCGWFYEGAIFLIFWDGFLKLQTSIYNCMHWYKINSKNERQFGEGKVLQISTHIFPHFVTSQWRHNNKFWIFKPAYTKLQSLIFRMMGRYFFYLIYLSRLRLWKNLEKASISLYSIYHMCISSIPTNFAVLPLPHISGLEEDI